MAIADLLWACPECGTVGGIARTGTCACGVRFRRGEGASIEAITPDGRSSTRTPAQWLEHLPEPATLLAAVAPTSQEPVRVARTLARETVGSLDIRWQGRFLNRVERYGPARAATLALHREALVYQPNGRAPRTWSLHSLTAVQASSSTLQVKPRKQPLVSFRFRDDSIFLWELLLQEALRDSFRRAGRGEIVEFQPRIAVR